MAKYLEPLGRDGAYSGKRLARVGRLSKATGGRVTRAMWHRRMIVIPGGALVLLAAAAIVVPLVWPFGYKTITDDLNRPPSLRHPLGTDTVGHDMLAQLLRGLGESLLIAATVTCVAAVIGTIIGVTSAFLGGLVETALMRLTDLTLTIPVIALGGFLATTAGSIPGPQWLELALVLSLILWTWPARLVRGVVLGLKPQEFITVAKATGARFPRLFISHLLPNALGQVLVASSIMVAVAILAESGLSFLGFGIQPPDTSLGVLVANAQSKVFTAPWLFYPPGIMILLIALCANFLGDGVRQRLDPKSQAMGVVGLTPVPVAKQKRKERGAKATGHVPVSTEATAVAVAIRNLTVTVANGTAIVRDVSLEVAPGETVAIVGESGAGKSTVGSAIVGSLPRGMIADGEILFRGRNILGSTFKRLRRIRGLQIGVILQDPMSSLAPVFKVGKQAAEALKGHKRDLGPKVVELFRAVGIPKPERRMHQFPHELSGGMKQRIGISMATGNNPQVIIADEPTTALDVTVQAGVMEVLKSRVADAGAALLFITHDLGLVAGSADTVIVMYRGRVVEKGPAHDIYKTPAMPYTQLLLAAVPELGAGRRRFSTIPAGDPHENDFENGCPFANRCPKRMDMCRTEPPLLKVSDKHRAACWLVDTDHPDAPQVQAPDAGGED